MGSVWVTEKRGMTFDLDQHAGRGFAIYDCLVYVLLCYVQNLARPSMPPVQVSATGLPTSLEAAANTCVNSPVLSRQVSHLCATLSQNFKYQYPRAHVCDRAAHKLRSSRETTQTVRWFRLFSHGRFHSLWTTLSQNWRWTHGAHEKYTIQTILE